MIVHNAFISGESPNFSIENILIGSVVLSGPLMKIFMITSSRDSANASMEPEITAGKIDGSVIVLNTVTFDAPKSIAASSIDMSKSASLDLTFISTNGIQKVVCARTNVNIPKSN